MLVAHVLRKYDPREWGGTETAILQLLDGLKAHDVKSTVLAPALDAEVTDDPVRRGGYPLRLFKTTVPVWGISPQQRRQLIAVGGNIISWSMMWQLWREPSVDLVHMHTLNRLAAMGRAVARARRVPFVITIHGGALDLPDQTRAALAEPLKGGWEWGKLVGAAFRSRGILADADAILTLNPREAELLRARYPRQRVEIMPHGIPVKVYREDCREAARRAFPQLKDSRYLMILGRIDPVKNQLWAVEALADTLRARPELRLVLVGAATDDAYAQSLDARVAELGMQDRVVNAGGLPPRGPELVGLLQGAEALIVPSLSETFALVIMEAWCAGTVAISSRTSGALQVMEDGGNGWLFDLDRPEQLREAVGRVLADPAGSEAMAARGRALVEERFALVSVAGRVKALYEELIAQCRK